MIDVTVTSLIGIVSSLRVELTRAKVSRLGFQSNGRPSGLTCSLRPPGLHSKAFCKTIQSEESKRDEDSRIPGQRAVEEVWRPRAARASRTLARGGLSRGERAG